ncbi:MAG: sigma-70 family RNA polymerase sigma factor [Gemmataceae bacterium]|nr:sigma-70 family RNA polymerase sigma factor [Gemmataceae bacterium]
MLFHWMQSRGLQSADAADLVQDVFRVLIRKLPEFDYDPKSSFRGWLRAITLNVWKDHCRKHAKRPALMENLEDWEKTEGCFSAEVHRRELVAQALVVLEPEFRPESWRIFVEHGVNGRPAGEVAIELNTTIGAVYAAKFRVLARVREYLRGILDEND